MCQLPDPLAIRSRPALASGLEPKRHLSPRPKIVQGYLGAERGPDPFGGGTL